MIQGTQKHIHTLRGALQGKLVFYHSMGITIVAPAHLHTHSLSIAHQAPALAKATLVAYLHITHDNDTSKYHVLLFVSIVCDCINMTYFKRRCISIVYNVTKIKPWQISPAINKDINHCTAVIHLWAEQMLIIENLKMVLVNVIFNLTCYGINVFHCVNLHLLSQASILGL